MQIPDEFLYYRITKTFPNAEIHIFNSCTISSPVLYTENGDFRNKLIFLSGSPRCHLSAQYPDSIFLCTAKEKNIVINYRNNCVILPQLSDPAGLFNYILSIFVDIQQWQDRLSEISSQGMSYQTLIDACENMIEDPIALVDTQFRYVAYSKNLAKKNGFEGRYVGAHKYLPLEQMNLITATPGFLDLEKIKGVFHNSFLEDMIYINIFCNERYVGRLGLPHSGISRKDRYYSALLQYLSEIIEDMYRKTGTFFQNSHEDDLKKQLMSIIHKETTDFGKLEQLLKKEGFSSQDEYCMVRFLPLIQSPDSGQNETTLRALGTNLEAICPGSLYIICDTELGLFVDLSCFRKASTRSFHSALADIIRDSLQRAGISRYFSAVTDICAAWKQAKIALTYGYRIHPTYWYFRFDDYALEYLLNEGLQDFNPEQVCSPVILQLRNYDQKKGTELGKTLATYLENALNASITAKKLYISRSTFLKRMKRIEMLTHLNLDNQVKRFYLELSFFLLKSY